MYVDDMTLTQARKWEQELKSNLTDASLSPAQKEQTQMDLQDVKAHIAALSTR